MTNEYYYMAGAEKVPIRKKTNAKLVVPARDQHIAHLGAKLAQSTRLSLEPRVPGSCLLVRGDRSKLEELRGYEDVHCTRSVFEHPSAPELILTNEVVVRFAPGFGKSEVEALCADLHCHPTQPSDNDDLYVLHVLDLNDDAPLDVANHLATLKDQVRYAEPNFIQAIHFAGPVAAPTDPWFTRQWYHETLRSLEAWSTTLGSAHVRVAVIDCGVDVGHPDLKANIAPGWDFDNGGPDPSPVGPDSHGTACAGLIAAALNGIGMVGMAPSCRITPIKVNAIKLTDWTAIFKFATANSEVISCSWSTAPSQTVSDAIEKAATGGRNGLGIPCFFATQDGGTTPIAFPASLTAAIAVGASTHDEQRAPYSNYGPGVDFLAPGNGDGWGIVSTKNSAGVASDAAYTDFGETSAATAIAAGVAALVLSANGNLTADEVRQILRETAQKIEPDVAQYSTAGWSSTHGYGRIDAAAAVSAALAKVGPRQLLRRAS